MISLPSTLRVYFARKRNIALLCCFIVAIGLSYGVAAAQPTASDGSIATSVESTPTTTEEPSIKIIVNDSTGSSDTASTPISVRTGGLSRFDTNGDNTIGRDEAVNVVSAFNGDTTIGGQPVGRDAAVNVISAFNSDKQIA